MSDELIALIVSAILFGTAGYTVSIALMRERFWLSCFWMIAYTLAFWTMVFLAVLWLIKGA